MTAPAIPVFPGRHGNAGNIVAGWRLPLIFQNPQFIATLADALQRSKAAVEGEKFVRSHNTFQGVVIRRKQGGNFHIATTPPSSEVVLGQEQVPSSFAGARRYISGASALVIAAPSFWRDNAITEGWRRRMFLDLARKMNAPVVVASARSATWVFTSKGEVVGYVWKRSSQ